MCGYSVASVKSLSVLMLMLMGGDELSRCRVREAAATDVEKNV